MVLGALIYRPLVYERKKLEKKKKNKINKEIVGKCKYIYIYTNVRVYVETTTGIS